MFRFFNPEVNPDLTYMASLTPFLAPPPHDCAFWVQGLAFSRVYIQTCFIQGVGILSLRFVRGSLGRKNSSENQVISKIASNNKSNPTEHSRCVTCLKSPQIPEALYGTSSHFIVYSILLLPPTPRLSGGRVCVQVRDEDTVPPKGIPKKFRT